MKAIRQGNDYVLAIELGEELIGTILAFAGESKIEAAEVHAIGALKDFELGYYWLSRKEYSRRKFSAIAELLSCSGNLAMKEGKIFAHLHAVLGLDDYSTVGGHLFYGTVAVTAEVMIRTLPEQMVREFDETTGLFLMNLPLRKTF